MVEMLQEDGLAAMGVEGGADALEMLRTSPGVELLVTDINMPGISGLELAGLVRDEFPAISLLVISGREHLRPDRLSASAVYLQKPFSARAFLTCVRSILNA